MLASNTSTGGRARSSVSGGTRVLMIGDSLSVGQFGASIGHYLAAGGGGDYQHDVEIMDRFIPVLRGRGPQARQIVWITPPDSSKFSGRVQRSVEGIIRDAARRYAFDVVASRPLTHYVMGKTGGDGVHYNTEASEAWASLVARELDRKHR